MSVFIWRKNGHFPHCGGGGGKKAPKSRQGGPPLPMYALTLFNVLFQEKIDTIHEQVIRGDLRSVRTLLDKKGWANARDHYGHSPLHKSVMANQDEVMRFVLESYPDHVEDRDNVRIKYQRPDISFI
jgi:hypothetical protein